MPADDLSGISGLDDRHRAVLAQKLGITTYYELIMADRQRIADAFGRRAIRPALEDVSAWQDEARRLRAASIGASVSALAAPGWQSAATFVVAFEERGQGAALERRIVAEQTEIEPEPSPQEQSQWAGWPCGDACRWMLERVGARAAPALPRPPRTAPSAEPGTAEADPGEAAPEEPRPAEASTAEASTAETRAAKTPAAGTPAALDIERADLADSRGSTELVAGSRPLPRDRLVWHQPAKLIVTLGSSPAGPRTSVVLQLAQPDGPKQNIAGHLDETGQKAEVELTGLAAGEYRPTIVASTRDGSFLPRVVKLSAVELAGPAPAPGGPP
jgi:hypothetical protein